MTNTCPICGYDELDNPAYFNNDPKRSASLEICPSCGFQYGWTDADQHITFEQWRDQWIKKGMPWDSVGITPPANWDPKKQLLNVTTPA